MFKKGFVPYLALIVVGLVTWFPVSLQLFSLKNDALHLDLPVKYFISECIHEGIPPVWMNTWALGFPLQSNINWSLFNPVQLFFYSAFHYNVYTLQWEFLFYVVAGGAGLYWLLRDYWKQSVFTSFLLAVAYMLSGFAVSSAQFLLFISSFAFLPFCFAAFLRFLKEPVFSKGLLLVVTYYLLLSGGYPPVAIIQSYVFLFMLSIKALSLFKEGKSVFWEYARRFARPALLSGLILLILAFPYLYYTVELMGFMERGALIKDITFQQSNYLHPQSVISLLMPLQSVNWSFENTSVLVQNTYFGLFPALLMVPAFFRAKNKKDHRSLLFLMAALISLLLSFDHHLPFRSWINILWGMGLFRGASIFRLFFIFFSLCFIAPYFSGILTDVMGLLRRYRKLTFWVLGWLFSVGVVVLWMLLSNWKSNGIGSGWSLKGILEVIGKQYAGKVSLLVLVISLGFALFSLHRWGLRIFAVVFVGEMAFNTLLCMPFFAVSSYSPASIDKILAAQKGFPTDNEVLTDSLAFRDGKANPFYNIHVFRKQTSLDDSYVYPLILKQVDKDIEALQQEARKQGKVRLISISGLTLPKDSVIVRSTKPGDIMFDYDISTKSSFRILQNYFPGWQAYDNGNIVPVEKGSGPGMQLTIGPGKGTVELKYKKDGVMVAAFSIGALFYIYILFLIGINYRMRRHRMEGVL